MAKVHINREDGTVGFCRAEKGQCPFGGDDQHYTSMTKAAAVFEKEMESELFKSLSNSTRNEIYSAAMEGDQAYHSGQAIHANPYPEFSEQSDAWLTAYQNPSEITEEDIELDDRFEDQLNNDREDHEKLELVRRQYTGPWDSLNPDKSEVIGKTARIDELKVDAETAALAREKDLEIVDSNGAIYILKSPSKGFIAVRKAGLVDIKARGFIPEDAEPPF